jgi:regulator of replication initiation timing
MGQRHSRKEMMTYLENINGDVHQQLNILSRQIEDAEYEKKEIHRLQQENEVLHKENTELQKRIQVLTEQYGMLLSGAIIKNHMYSSSVGGYVDTL